MISINSLYHRTKKTHDMLKDLGDAPEVIEALRKEIELITKAMRMLPVSHHPQFIENTQRKIEEILECQINGMPDLFM